jgi:hypothetical protein
MKNISFVTRLAVISAIAVICLLLLCSCKKSHTQEMYEQSLANSMIHFQNRTEFHIALHINGIDGWTFIQPYDSLHPENSMYDRKMLAIDGKTLLLGHQWNAFVSFYDLYPSDVPVDTGIVTNIGVMLIESH